MTGPRRPIPARAIVAIVLVSVVLLFGGPLAFYIAVNTTAEHAHRFDAAGFKPSCVIDGSNFELSMPIGHADSVFSKYDMTYVRPDQSSNVRYLDVTTVPASKPVSKPDADPGFRDVQIPSGAIVVVTFRIGPSSSTATIDGVRVDWSQGEIGKVQVLPVKLRANNAGCSIG